MKSVFNWLWVQCWAFVWDCSELSGIGLGKAAPWVFEQMTGREGRRVY